MPESRALAVQVWDKGMVGPVDKAIRDANLGLSPTVEGQILRIRIPELNEQRRKELAKLAHKYAEESRVAVRHVRRDGMDILKKLVKDKAISEDDEKRHETEVQKATDAVIVDIDQRCSRARKRKSCRSETPCVDRTSFPADFCAKAGRMTPGVSLPGASTFDGSHGRGGWCKA